MKRLLLIFLISASLLSVARAGDVWVSPAGEQLFSRQTPFDMAIGAGGYVASFEALKLTGMKDSYAKWLAFGIVGFGSFYYQREIKFEQFHQKASFTGIGFSLSSAVITQHFWAKKKK